MAENEGRKPRPKDGRTPSRGGGRRGNRTGRNHGYVHKSPAVCIVVHDPSGRPMPDETAAEIVNTIHEIAFSKGYLINFTRT